VADHTALDRLEQLPDVVHRDAYSTRATASGCTATTASSPTRAPPTTSESVCAEEKTSDGPTSTAHKTSHGVARRQTSASAQATTTPRVMCPLGNESRNGSRRTRSP